MDFFCRLWDLGQQRCVHSYAVHTDSVWALASTPTFSHVYSGGRDLSVSTFCINPVLKSCLIFSQLFLFFSNICNVMNFLMLSSIFLQLYLTDLATRESLLLCTKEHPILQLALHDDNIWVATTDSSVHRWPADGRNPQKVFQRGGSFLAGNLSFSRARVSLEGSTPVSNLCLFVCKVVAFTCYILFGLFLFLFLIIIALSSLIFRHHLYLRCIAH